MRWSRDEWSRWRANRRSGRGSQKVVTAMAEHEGREPLHDAKRVLVEIATHGIRVPSAKEFDGISINFANQKGHSTASTKGSG